MKELSIDRKDCLLTAVFAFIAGFAILFIYSMTMDIRHFLYDSGVYWELSKSFEFEKDGFFFPYSIRGYVFLFFPYIGKSIFRFTGLDEIIRFRTFVASFLALFILIIFLPQLLVATKSQTFENVRECYHFFFKWYKLLTSFLFVFLFIALYLVWAATYTNIELPLKNISPPLMRGIK